MTPDYWRATGLVLQDLLGWGLFALLIAFYFIPVIVAALRNSPYTGPIFLINFFTGWTLLGWVGALVWASMPKERR